MKILSYILIIALVALTIYEGYQIVKTIIDKKKKNKRKGDSSL